MAEPIAIVGQGCVLPGALDPAALWDLVREGRDAIGTAPAEYLRVSGAPEPDGGPPWHNRGGYIHGFDAVFDAQGFGLPAQDVLALDRLLRWLLYAGRAALREAGHDPLRPSARAGAVFGNLSLPTPSLSQFAEGVWLSGLAADALGALGLPPRPDPRNRFMSGLPAHLAARGLGLAGGAFALDAACASSLYAVKLACDRLRDHEVDLMLAGAVSAADPLFLHIGFRALRALSPTGQSRPFHRDADGLLPAEGAVCVALKRLDDARRAGDRVLGVILGVGLSNDGGGGGLLAPASEGQVRAMELAYREAGRRPQDISLVECHATGTAAGDATELRSLGRVFAGAQGLPLGSLKSNLGHLLTASGLAGLLKVLAAMAAGVRPATLHAERPLPDLGQTPFRLLEALEPWETPGPRCAAVSSFGFGGCNAHLVVEQWEAGGGGRARGRAPLSQQEVAVVGVGVVAGGVTGADELARVLLTGDPAPPAPRTWSGIPLAGLRFPPLDLERALPQQLLVLAAARQALASSLPAQPQRTGVLIGMQCDAEIARHGARRRMGDWAERWSKGGLAVSPDWLAAARDAICPAVDAAAVLGLLPNIIANRVNGQWGFAGPGFTVSAEECSGLRALALAARALRAGELDAVLVGAVDLCAEPVHALAARGTLPANRQTPGDAVVALVCKRRTDAERDGDTIYALLGGTAPGQRFVLGEPDDPITPRFGHAHAASGLLLLTAAILACHHRALPADRRGPRPWLPNGRSPRCVEVCVPALGAQETRIRVREAERGVGVATARSAVATRKRRPTPAPAAQGELAFVFTGAGAAYGGMGADLLAAFPDLAAAGAERLGAAIASAAWVYGQGPVAPPDAYAKLAGASLLTQVHAELALRVLGLRPAAAIGLSSGESNALAALGAWSDLGGLGDDLREIYQRELGGAFAAVARAWGLPPGTGVPWACWRLLHPAVAVRAVVAGERRVRLLGVYAEADCAIGGDAGDCARVIAQLGAHAVPLGYDLAVHCPEVREVGATWRAIHHRPTVAPPGVRFYSGATCAPYVPDAAAAADALVDMACTAVDFPRLIRRAWDDGVRVFLELGPRDLCTRWIGEALVGREHVAVALDVPGTPSLDQARNAAEVLAAAGVAVDRDALQARLAALRPRVDAAPAQLTFALHRPAVTLPPLPPRLSAAGPGGGRGGAEAQAVARETSAQAAGSVAVPAGAQWQALLAGAHQGFLDQQTQAHRRFLEVQAAGWRAVVGAVGGGASHPSGAQGVARAPAGAAAPPSMAHAPHLLTRADPHVELGSAPQLPDSHLRLERADLERLAGGRVSSVFGPAFASQDGYRRQVRMPLPPLLLVDRVTGLWGAPGGMGRGRVLTETDIPPDAWYLECGRMPAGLMVEAGQSDLLLISWLGADRHNRGERVYRLLGCELEFHGDLPRAGETLCYDIRVDGHARHGDVRLFFFSYDCRVGGQRRLSVRDGQAGFFSDEELRGSAGVAWNADAPRGGARVDPPAVHCTKRSFAADEVAAFAAGDLARCFGAGFTEGSAQVRPAGIPTGRMQLFTRVTRFEPQGGPWARGYLRAEADIRGDEWFFPGHFHNDPVMPGTLMCQAGLQAMAFYLAAMGFTLGRDGWRFAPVTGEPYRMVCRGQVTPQARRMVYEVFVHEVWAGPEPTLYADLLLTVDGLKVFHGQRMGLRLVPDWPLSSRPDLLRQPAVRRQAPGGAGLDEAAVLACAWGRPSDAFGEAYRVFDGTRRLPRLPGPPYLFMTRVRQVEGQGAGAWAEVEYDVPPDAWYFGPGDSAAMPWCVLLEAALQPCGWLTAYLGIPLTSVQDLHFRNLDGSAVVHGEVRRKAGRLVTRVEVRSVSRVGAIVIEGFHVRCSCGDRLVLEMETMFGHFTADALALQGGLPGPAARVTGPRDAPGSGGGDPGAGGPDDEAVDLPLEPAAPGRSGTLHLPANDLRMLDRLTGWWPDGGKAGLGRLRARKRIDPGEWFFKAHFFQDPVQPGSLGLEAMVQLLQVYMLRAGLAAAVPDPRFVPLAEGEELTWKYRGQVGPGSDLIEVELEITAVQREPSGVLARADGWLSVDGRCIYHASGLAMRIVSGWRSEPPAADTPAQAPPAGASEARADGQLAMTQPPALTRSSDGSRGWDAGSVRGYWRERLAVGPWVGEDVYMALLRSFVRAVSVADPEAAARVRGQPLLFCANHQTGIESLLFCTLAAALHGTPVVGLAKVEHRQSWLGGLIATLASHPGVDQPAPMVFFDRTDPASLPALLASLRGRMAEGTSVLVHVEGTRALSCRQQVARLSANLVELALAADAPIVPVRFSGGLPVEPAPQRLEFPVGFAAQDYHFGSPLLPRTLRPLSLAARRRAVLGAIQATGPAAEAEEPNPPCPAFAQAVAAHTARTGAAPGDAVVLQALRALPEPCAETREILAGLAGGRWTAPAGPRGPWLAAFARRLYGPRGPEIAAGG